MGDIQQTTVSECWKFFALRGYGALHPGKQSCDKQNKEDLYVMLHEYK